MDTLEPGDEGFALTAGKGCSQEGENRTGLLFPCELPHPLWQSLLFQRLSDWEMEASL